MKVCPTCGKEYMDTTTLCSEDGAVLRRSEDPLVGQTLAGKYLVESLIKRGGMGSVYLGKHILMDKTVAIKVLRAALAVDDAVVARFSREAKAASRISHPHAVNVTDFGEAENGVVFLVMEYLDGRSLKEIVRDEGPLALDRTVEIVRQVAGALDAAHAQNVIHRDLKSDNIMLVRHDGDEWAKVLDFGIAKIQQPEGLRDVDITEANLVVGTPQYMSPEQCSQTAPLDRRSDIYSLGVIIYEMLAGRVPFTGESPTVIMMKQVQDPPPSVLATRADLPDGVDAVLKRALAKQPIDRYQTAGDLAEALSDAASGAGEVAGAAAINAGATVPNSAVTPVADDPDEVTLVRPAAQVRPDQPYREPPPAYAQPDAQPEPAKFNPWKVMVPAAIALLAVFAIVFLLTRSANQTGAGQTPGETPLAVDPNGQPVQPAGSPTGDSERDIRAIIVPSPAAVATPTAIPNAKVGTQVPATVNGNFGENDNSNSRGNKNSNQASSTPSDEPPPKPSPTVKTVPKATPAKPAGTPEQPPSNP